MSIESGISARLRPRGHSFDDYLATKYRNPSTGKVLKKVVDAGAKLFPVEQSEFVLPGHRLAHRNGTSWVAVIERRPMVARAATSFTLTKASRFLSWCR